MDITGCSKFPWERSCPCVSKISYRRAKTLERHTSQMGPSACIQAEWNIGESSGALAAFCVQQKVLPRQVRAKPSLLADFQKRLRALGVELEWPKPLVAQSYNSMYTNVSRMVLRRSHVWKFTAGNLALSIQRP